MEGKLKEQMPLVSISCISYNHINYIRQCLDGFLMQKTKFTFEVLIHDDASTDGTDEIIKEYEKKYPDIIKPLYERENQYQQGKPFGSSVWNIPRAKGKYIAICEGDDYWTDPYKLQKQVDYLENHPEYVLSHTAFHYHIEYENNQLKDSSKSTSRNLEIIKNDASNIISYILNNNDYRIQTATVLFKKDIYELIQKDKQRDNEPRFLMGDTPLWVRLCKYGKIHFIEESTTNYRIHMGSACRDRDNTKKLRFTLSCSEMQVYYTELFNIDNIHTKKIKKRFKKRLFIYKIFDNSYTPVINYKIKTISDYIFFYILIKKPFLILAKPFYTLYYKLKSITNRT